MKKPGKRTLTGAIFGIVLLSVLFSGSKIATTFFFITALLAVYEFLKINNLLKYPLYSITTLLISAITYLLFSATEFSIAGTTVLWLLLALPGISAIVTLLSQKEDHIQSYVAAQIGPFIITLPFALISFFYHKGNAMGFDSRVLPMAFFCFIWANDMFAYFIGKAYGKTPLSPLISPNKTLEGTIGGITCVVILAIVAWQIFPGPGVLFWLGMGSITAVGSIFGDLLESAMKRMLGIKDSGNILPGHGGILDRFDSMLMAAPFIFVFLKLLS